MEMPEIAQQKDAVPVPDSGQERLLQHESIDVTGPLRRIGIGDHQPDIWPTSRMRSWLRLFISAWISPAIGTLVYPSAGAADSPKPRRSGAITVYLSESFAISGRHIWLVSAKPCSRTIVSPMPCTLTPLTSANLLSIALAPSC